MPTRIFVVRHGETEWSKSGQHTSRTDIALTAGGEEGARRLAPVLSRVSFVRVFTSPRSRARSTCALAGLSAGAQSDVDLSEWDYGSLEGLTTREIHAADPEWNLFRDGCAGGESPDQVSLRADRALGRLRLIEGNVAVFTHGHFGRVLAARWIGLPVSAAERFVLGTASLGILGFEHGDRPLAAIELWNATP